MKKHFLCLLLLLLAGAHFVCAERINDLTGINAHPQDPLNMQLRFSWVRIWHDWSDDVGNAPGTTATCFDTGTASDWNLQWNPSVNQTGPKLNFTEYFGKLSRRGIPILKALAPRMRGHTAYPDCFLFKPLEQKPFCLEGTWINTDPAGCGVPAQGIMPPLPSLTAQSTPETYRAHAMWVSLFAAKFGASGGGFTQAFASPYFGQLEPPTIGQGLIQYLEDNNEPNKSWYDTGLSDQDFATGNTRWYFSPGQFKAMIMADYNGNGSAMTVGAQPIGFTNASSGITFVLGGLAGLHGKYYEDMWANPAPPSGMVANFHHYCTNQTALQTDPSAFFNTTNGEYVKYDKYLIGNGAADQGVCPEADNMRSKLKWMRKGTTVGMTTYPAMSGIEANFSEFWLSEFGYDTFKNGVPGSGVEAQPIAGNASNDGPYDAQKVQAQWLVRGVLETAWSKAIDKMMLYELRDHPSGGNVNYDYSGLLTADGKTKRSWYYIMTLKNILGEYVFAREITNGLEIAPGKFFTVATDGNKPIRIYEFRRGSINSLDVIYAIWSPTQTAVKPFAASIFFPKNVSNFAEYNLNGLATLYQIVELSEKGRRWNWSSGVQAADNSITIGGDVKVSETPIFLKINQGLSSLTPPAHVTNLQCTPSCCGSMDLSWTPVTEDNLNTLVFYRENTGNTCPPFDFSECTLFSNNIGIQRQSVTVTGLKQNTAYCFYVIPIRVYGSIPPDHLDDTPSCFNTTDNCSNCLLNFSTSSTTEVTFDPNYQANNPAGFSNFQSQTNEILSKDDVPNTCSDIDPFCDPNNLSGGWTHFVDPAINPPYEPNTFYINFATPKKLKSIYLQDWIGNGEILIQYQACNCPKWRTLRKVQLVGNAPCNGRVQVIYLSDIPNVVIKKLRISKLHSDAVVRRIYFCGADATCPSPGYTDVAGEPSDFTADEIRKNAAVLRWNAAKVNAQDASSVFVDNYLLEVSQLVNASNELVNPVQYQIEADYFQPEALYRLSGLAPGTTYYADLKLAFDPDPCPPHPSGLLAQRATFTTETDGVGGRSDETSKALTTQTADPFKVLMRPNPAAGEVQVSVSSGELETVLLMDTNGRLIKKTPASGASLSMTLEGLHPGVYWVRVIRTDKTFLTVLLVKS